MRFHPVYKKYMGHQGVDLDCKTGTIVKSSLDGIVEMAGNQRGYGNVVIINHGIINGKEIKKTKYAHLSKISVSEGMKISRQQNIGLSGGKPGTPGAGTSTGEHLHFEILENGKPVDPMQYLEIIN